MPGASTGSDEVTRFIHLLALATYFGTPRQNERNVTLRLAGRSEIVFVGEFEVK